MHRLYLTQNSVPAAPPLEVIDIAARTGFDGVSLRFIPVVGMNMPFFPVVGDRALIANIKSALASTGTRLFEIFTLYIKPEIDFASYAAALEVGAELGASYAMALCFDSDPVRRVDNFARLCDIAGKAGIDIGLEFSMASEIRSMGAAIDLVRATGSPHASLMVDPAHFRRCGGVPTDLDAVDRGLMRYAQFNDLELATNELCMPGEGDLPLREVLRRLPKDIPLVVEVTPSVWPKDTTPLAWAKRIATTTRAYLGQ